MTRPTILVVLLLSACDPSQGDRAAATSTANDSAALAVAQDTASWGPRACALLSSDEIAAVTKISFKPGVTAHDYGGSSQCRFDHEDGSQGIMFTLHNHEDIENYRKVPGSEELVGLGSAAVWNEGTSQLAVHVGDAVFSISFLTTPAGRQNAIRIAEQVVVKLRG